jgi:hypothetical protein
VSFFKANFTPRGNFTPGHIGLSSVRTWVLITGT